MKIVINTQFGGFGLSIKAQQRLIDLGCKHMKDHHSNHSYPEEARSCPILIQVIEELGEDANGGYATLEIVEIPDDVEWTIEEYDGVEWVAEKHRTWR